MNGNSKAWNEDSMGDFNIFCTLKFNKRGGPQQAGDLNKFPKLINVGSKQAGSRVKI